MSDAGSPFLRRDSKQDWNQWIAWDEYRQAETYRERHTRSAYSQRLLMETLRYRLYQRAGTLGCFMQRLGNLGRQILPWKAR